MRADGPHITVGTNWITVCNGVWHAIFLADDSAMYPGSCSCETDSELSGVMKKFDEPGTESPSPSASPSSLPSDERHL